MRKQDSADNADTKAGSKGRHIDKKGVPTHSVTGVPGYKDAPGTPKWVSGPAKKAAGRAK